jgi:hypothetical protein
MPARTTRTATVQWTQGRKKGRRLRFVIWADAKLFPLEKATGKCIVVEIIFSERPQPPMTLSQISRLSMRSRPAITAIPAAITPKR